MKEAEREVNYSRLAELQYGEMARLEGELKKEEEKLAALQKSEKMLKEEVDEEEWRNGLQVDRHSRFEKCWRERWRSWSYGGQAEAEGHRPGTTRSLPFQTP